MAMAINDNGRDSAMEAVTATHQQKVVMELCEDWWHNDADVVIFHFAPCVSKHPAGLSVDLCDDPEVRLLAPYRHIATWNCRGLES